MHAGGSRSHSPSAPGVGLHVHDHLHVHFCTCSDCLHLQGVTGTLHSVSGISLRGTRNKPRGTGGIRRPTSASGSSLRGPHRARAVGGTGESGARTGERSRGGAGNSEGELAN
jgi:hypothetical protein